MKRTLCERLFKTSLRRITLLVTLPKETTSLEYLLLVSKDISVPQSRPLPIVRARVHSFFEKESVPEMKPNIINIDDASG
jgi:hypothetical protein